MKEPIVVMDSVSKSFGGVTAAQNFSLSLPEGTIQGIIGPNGAGKTTIFNLLSRVYPIDNGSITFMGQDVTHSTQVEISRMGISRTFQNTRLFTGLSVLDNVKVGIDYAGKYSILEAIFLTPRRWREERRIAKEAKTCLETLNLSQYAQARPSNLPYGVQRRVEIARAIVSRPKVLLLDEPAAGLNPTEVEELIAFIKAIKSAFHLTIVVIEHRMDLIMSLCDFIHVQNFGQTIAAGTPEEIQKNPDVLAAYLGEEE